MAYEMNPGLSDPFGALLKGPPGDKGDDGMDGRIGDDGPNGDDFPEVATPYDVPTIPTNAMFDYRHATTGAVNGVNFMVAETIATGGAFSAVYVAVFVSLAKLQEGVIDATFYTLQHPPLETITVANTDQIFQMTANGDLTYTCPKSSADDSNARGLAFTFSYFTHN